MLTDTFPRRPSVQSQLSPHVFVDLKQNFIVLEIGVPPAVGVGVQRLKRDQRGS